MPEATQNLHFKDVSSHSPSGISTTPGRPWVASDTCGSTVTPTASGAAPARSARPSSSTRTPFWRGWPSATRAADEPTAALPPVGGPQQHLSGHGRSTQTQRKAPGTDAKGHPGF